MPSVLGLDLSLTSTGVVVWDGTVVGFANPKTKAPDNQSDQKRIDTIVQEVVATITAYDPTDIWIENHAFGASVGGDTRPHEVSGVIKYVLWKRARDFRLVSPLTVKKFATGYGKASKEDMLVAARVIWPECPNHDLADALHIARYAYHQIEEESHASNHE